MNAPMNPHPDPSEKRIFAPCARGTVLLAAMAMLLALAGPVCAQVNSINNPDFSANAAAYSRYPGYNGGSGGNPAAPTSWTVSSPSSSGINGYDAWYTVFYDNNSKQPNRGVSWTSSSGRTVKDFFFQQNSGNTISQSVTTISGHTYTVTFDASSRVAHGPGDWSVSIGSTTFDTGGP